MLQTENLTFTDLGLIYLEKKNSCQNDHSSILIF